MRLAEDRVKMLILGKAYVEQCNNKLMMRDEPLELSA